MEIDAEAAALATGSVVNGLVNETRRNCRDGVRRGVMAGRTPGLCNSPEDDEMFRHGVESENSDISKVVDVGQPRHVGHGRSSADVEDYLPALGSSASRILSLRVLVSSHVDRCISPFPIAVIGPPPPPPLVAASFDSYC